MLPKYRLRSVFRGEKADIMPWFVDLAYWYGGKLEEVCFLRNIWEIEGLKLYVDLGCGVYEELYLPIIKLCLVELRLVLG